MWRPESCVYASSAFEEVPSGQHHEELSHVGSWPSVCLSVYPSICPSRRTGPEAGACWACPMNGKVARVTGVLEERAERREVTVKRQSGQDRVLLSLLCLNFFNDFSLE